MTGEAGTGVCSKMETVRLHVVAATPSAADFHRIASWYRGRRQRTHKTFSGAFDLPRLQFDDKARFLEALRIAVYGAYLASYIQDFNLIEAADRESKWCIDYGAVWQIWRAGASYRPTTYSRCWNRCSRATRAVTDSINLLFECKLAEDLEKAQPALKKVVLACVEAENIALTFSASLEYIKYISSVGSYIHPLGSHRPPFLLLHLGFR